MSTKHSRRSALKKIVGSSASLMVSSSLLSPVSSPAAHLNSPLLKGNINHSVCQWTYGFMPVEELCKVVKEIGFSAIDLVGPKDWPTLQKYGIYSSMCQVAGPINLTEGFNRTENHQMLIKEYLDIIHLMVKAGYGYFADNDQ